MKSESRLEAYACQLIYKHLGIENVKLSTPGNTGFPDRMFLIPGGKPLFIEFKRPGEKPRAKQVHIHKKLRSLNYKVEIHDDPIEAFEAVINIMDTPRLSKNRREILIGARRRCALLRSGSGENLDHPSSDKGP